MEFKTDALLLKASDYGENDKMITLLTADRGKISACMKGVKKTGAKLKFAAQPFCFAEYVLAARGGRNTVISASLHDGFYFLRENLSAFYAAATVAGACDKLLLEGMTNARLLVGAVRAIGAFERETDFPLLRFLLFAAAEAGYPVSAAECPVCGKIPSGRMRFDMQSGRFTCADCSEGVPASEVTYLAVRAAERGERAEEGVRRALRLLSAYFSRRIEAELPALSTFLELGL